MLDRNRIVGDAFNSYRAYDLMREDKVVTDGDHVYMVREICGPDNVPITYVLTFPDWDDVAECITPSLEWKDDYKYAKFYVYEP